MDDPTLKPLPGPVVEKPKVVLVPEFFATKQDKIEFWSSWSGCTQNAEELGLDPSLRKHHDPKPPKPITGRIVSDDLGSTRAVKKDFWKQHAGCIVEPNSIEDEDVLPPMPPPCTPPTSPSDPQCQPGEAADKKCSSETPDESGIDAGQPDGDLASISSTPLTVIHEDAAVPTDAVHSDANNQCQSDGNGDIACTSPKPSVTTDEPVTVPVSVGDVCAEENLVSSTEPASTETQEHGNISVGDVYAEENLVSTTEPASTETQEHGNISVGDVYAEENLVSSTEPASTETQEHGNTDYERVKSIVERIQCFRQSAVDHTMDSDSEDEDELSTPPSTDAKSTEMIRRLDTSSSLPSSSEKQNQPEQQPGEQHAEQHEEQPIMTEEHDSTMNADNSEPGNPASSLNILRLPGTDICRLYQCIEEQHCIVMLYSNKNLLGDVHIAQGNTNAIVGTAAVHSQKKIENFAELRRMTCFKDASREVRDVWRKRLLDENKRLFAWIISGVEKFSEPRKLQGRVHHKRHKVDLCRLVSFSDVQIPKMDLKETAMYFINLLSQEDLQRLETTMKHLDNCELKIGTACSGTDIAVSVTKQTISALASHFGVSWNNIVVCHVNIWIFSRIYIQ